MNCRLVLALGGMTLAAIAGVSAALALPKGPLPTLPANEARAEEGLVHKVHGCHRSCEWGPVFRWHRHVGAACAVVACVPLAPQPNRCWVDAWGVRHCSW
jgi:hypothetical protein